ncbi:MAG: hypothetical protein ABH879_10500 [archaeon]
MGHTVWSQRIVLDIMLSELKAYGKSLRAEERIIYEKLLKDPLKHVGSISYASSIHVWAFLLLSILLEQEKKINSLVKHESLADGRIQEGQLSSALAEGAAGHPDREEVQLSNIH